MAGTFADTSDIVAGQEIDAADVKTPIDALDTELATFWDGTDIDTGSGDIAGASVTANAGDVTVDRTGDSAAGRMIIDVDSGQTAGLYQRTGGVNRWITSKNSAAESGSNAGSNLAISRYADNGSYLDDVLLLIRSNGLTRVQNNLDIGDGIGAVGTSGANVLMIENGTPPGSSPANGVQLYAEDVAASSELKVRDEGGTVTTLSSHNPELIDTSGRITTYVHKEHNPFTGRHVELDIFGALAELEASSGKTFIYSAPVSPLKRENPFKRKAITRRERIKQKMRGAA